MMEILSENWSFRKAENPLQENKEKKVKYFDKMGDHRAS